jgi:hypothetical protein
MLPLGGIARGTERSDVKPLLESAFRGLGVARPSNFLKQLRIGRVRFQSLLVRGYSIVIFAVLEIQIAFRPRRVHLLRDPASVGPGFNPFPSGRRGRGGGLARAPPLPVNGCAQEGDSRP